jgi:hypothetical protein
MTTNSTDPLTDVDPDSVSAGDVDPDELRAALASPKPLVRQRGVDACESLAETDLDAVRPLLDEVAALPADDNAAIGLGAISALDAVRDADPAALDGRLGGVVAAAGDEIVDVQLTAASLRTGGTSPRRSAPPSRARRPRSTPSSSTTGRRARRSSSTIARSASAGSPRAGPWSTSSSRSPRPSRGPRSTRSTPPGRSTRSPR